MRWSVRPVRVTSAAGTFGYDNIEVCGPDGRRSHVVREINNAEAVVIRRIFEMSAKGVGLTTIAKTLNAEAAPAPRSQQARPRAWAPSTVREILYRDLYRALIVWNKTRKRNAWGQAKRETRKAGEWFSVPFQFGAQRDARPIHCPWQPQLARFHQRELAMPGCVGPKVPSPTLRPHPHQAILEVGISAALQERASS